MRISLDRVADAAYIKISNKKVKRSISVSEYCNVDLDKDGEIVGIELLFVSQYATDFRMWLGLSDAAAYLNKSPVTIRRWAQKGNIPSYKIGREYLFVKEELDDFIQEHKCR